MVDYFTLVLGQVAGRLYVGWDFDESGNAKISDMRQIWGYMGYRKVCALPHFFV